MAHFFVHISTFICTLASIATCCKDNGMYPPVRGGQNPLYNIFVFPEPANATCELLEFIVTKHNGTITLPDDSKIVLPVQNACFGFLKSYTNLTSCWNLTSISAQPCGGPILLNVASRWPPAIMFDTKITRISSNVSYKFAACQTVGISDMTTQAPLETTTQQIEITTVYETAFTVPKTAPKRAVFAFTPVTVVVIGLAAALSLSLIANLILLRSRRKHMKLERANVHEGNATNNVSQHAENANGQTGASPTPGPSTTNKYTLEVKTTPKVALTPNFPVYDRPTTSSAASWGRRCIWRFSKKLRPSRRDKDREEGGTENEGYLAPIPQPIPEYIQLDGGS